MTGQPPSHGPAAAMGYEISDFRAKGIFWFVVGLLLLIVITGYLMVLLMDVWANVYPTRLARPRASSPSSAPAPRLETYPAGDLQRVRQREDSILNAYGWIDRQAGVAHIPIERAMELTVQRGLPVRTVPKPNEVQPPAIERRPLPPVVERTNTIGNP